MRKNNHTVIRSITIGIAAVLAASQPMTAFASEPMNENPDSNVENKDELTSEEAEAAYEAEISADETEGSIETAEEAVAAVDAEAIEADMQTVTDALTEAKADVNDAEDNLSGAVDDLESAKAADTEAVNKAAEADAAKAMADGYTDMADEAIEASDAATAAAVAAADTANTSADETEARQAKQTADESLATAIDELTEANDALTGAKSKLDAAEAAYKASKGKSEEAKAAIEAAQAELDEATEASVKAVEAMQKAIEQFADLDDLNASSDELQAIYDKYVEVLNEYDRVMTSAGAFNDNRTIHNVGSGQYWDRGRELCKLLVTYIINNREDVDPETADIKIGKEIATTGDKEEHDGAILYFRFTDKNGNTTLLNEKAEGSQGWIRNGDNSSLGYVNEDNHVKVVYKDKNGTEHVEFYNYIKDLDDKATGSVYLVKLDYEVNNGYQILDANGKEINKKIIWTKARINGEGEDAENNYEDIDKLTDAIAALNALSDKQAEYGRAKSAVEVAAARVSALKNEIEALKNVKASDLALDALKSALESAKADYNTALGNKSALEQKVEEAKAIVEAIDLTRFDVVPVIADVTDDTAATDDADDTVDVTGTTVMEATDVTVVTPVLTAPAATQTITATATAADDTEDAENGDTEEVVLGDAMAEDSVAAGATVATAGAGAGTEEAVAETENIGDNEVPLAGLDGRNAVITGIKDNAVPLTKGEKQSFWWLILAAISAATGIGSYKYYADALEEQKVKEEN